MMNDESRGYQQTASSAVRCLLSTVCCLLACAAFGLICVGGLVTSYDAGMAVPDWPSTYGHNLFLYPWGSWLSVWDVFLAHGHRLLGATVGMITIGLAVVLWLYDRRKWIRWLGVAAVAGVGLQGTLGGLRVISDEILLAKIHGSTAPLFFACCTMLVTLTSRPWLARTARKDQRTVGRSLWLPVAATAGMYLDIVLCAQLRHTAADAATGWFVLWVWLHLICVGLLLIGLAWLLIFALRRLGDEPMIVRRAWLLVGLFAVQLVLGAGAWVTNFGWPNWFKDYVWALQYTVVAEGPLQVVMTTAYVAIGSLNVAAAFALSTWWLRSDRRPCPRPRA